MSLVLPLCISPPFTRVSMVIPSFGCMVLGLITTGPRGLNLSKPIQSAKKSAQTAYRSGELNRLLLA